MSGHQQIDVELSHVILHTLHAVLSPDKVLIDQAQQQLKVLQVRSEYSLVLVHLLVDQSSDFAIRQLAGVLFKQFVEVHWSPNSEKFAEPEIEPQIKTQVKRLLPNGLSDQSSKIRTICAYAVGTIAQWDWPELWPELFPLLLSALDGNRNAAAAAAAATINGTAAASSQAPIDFNAVHGALEALTEIVQEVTDMQMPQVAPAILPQLYKIFVDPQCYSIGLRKRAVEIFASLVTVIAEMSEYDTSAAKKYLYPYVTDFTYAMIKVLSLTGNEATTGSTLVDYDLKKEIIKTLSTLLKSFPKKLNSMMNEILAQVWGCLVQSSHIYVSKIVNSETVPSGAESTAAANSSNEPADFEDERKNFEQLLYQLFEFILILKEKSRYKSIIKKAIDELCYYAILYMQITDEQVENWTANPEQFVQDEDEESYSYSVRISGQELIESITADYKRETASAICKTVNRHMEQALKLRASNDANWWKIHEACLLAISTAKPVLQELAAAGQLEFDLTAFVNQFVVAGLHESNYPFLVGRALFTASQFPKMLSGEILETLLNATGAALQNNQSQIIRASAMKSTYCFCDELTNENQQQLLVPHLPQLTEGLIQMIMQNSANQIGTLTMETLVTILAIDEQFVASVEPKLSPLAIALFLKNTSDPLVNSIVTDIIKTLINNPYTNAKIEQRIMPTLLSILSTTLSSNKLGNVGADNEPKDLTNLLTSTLDLITALIRSTTQIPLSDVSMNAFVQVIQLCLKSDDTAVLQSGGECLRAYISKSIDQVVSWKDEQGASALSYILLVIGHMLDPKTSEHSCACIGKLISALIRHTSHVIGENLETILKAVLSKMQSSSTLAVQQSLIMVFAHLVHARLDAVLTFLSNLPGPSGQPVLEFLMTEWVAKQSSFMGPYECKISILALAKLLEHAISTEDKRFQNIFVRGDRIINPVEGIKTRSKAKEEKELYTQVPLLVRVYKLLINEVHGLLEAQKANLEDYEEDEDNVDEEAADGDDNDDDENKEDIEVDENGATEAEHINNYLNKHDLFEEAYENEDNDEDDPDALRDPLWKIDLLEFLVNYLRTLSQHPCYNLFSQHHNHLEREVLKEIQITNV